ncbi:SDR family NAD(P)-dependent oxidoreductase [Altericroceibacterium endophyticum]|uniref:SDR family NAD(P)-dependent oxidoreductase n=1 Tax=Altericroceibacterium endophyticum TaxID=1808508 RepID=A0A6I4T4T8_9SPHN|nr:SDR family NAD(P)-dependent oxidoreductase [Altericroceibacterium endophyticum]MXO65232.1 SDR family NAD(P)-dependent oxidoreductase [Altericroceibacterium endophyticum]
MNPSNKLAIVTGGNSGLGEATTKALMAAGARVVTFDVSGEAPAGAISIPCDVSDPAAVKQAVAQVAQDHGPIAILANCAGIGGIGGIANADGPGDLEAFRRVVDVNLMGAVNVTAEVAHRMIGNDPEGDDAERGVIINACSIASFEGQEGMGAYTASKSALAGLTLVWARDLSRHHIRAAGIAPGFFDTPLVAGLPEEMVEELLADSEFPKRAGRSEEYAEAALFVIRNPMFNGDVMRLDAGTRPPARTRWTAN